jgi:hypothetical protein
LKNFEVDLFTRTTKEEELEHPSLQLIKGKQKPIHIKINLRKIQLTLSNAFDRSSFITIEGIFFVLNL